MGQVFKRTQSENVPLKDNPSNVWNKVVPIVTTVFSILIATALGKLDTQSYWQVVIILAFGLILLLILLYIFQRFSLIERLREMFVTMKNRRYWAREASDILELLGTAIDAEMKLVDTNNQGSIGRVVDRYFQQPLAQKLMMEAEFRGFHYCLRSFRNELELFQRRFRILEHNKREYRPVLKEELTDLTDNLGIFHERFFEWCNEIVLQHMMNLGISCPNGSQPRQEFITFKENLSVAFDRINALEDEFYREIDAAPLRESQTTTKVIITRVRVKSKLPKYELQP